MKENYIADTDLGSYQHKNGYRSYECQSEKVYCIEMAGRCNKNCHFRSVAGLSKGN